MASRGRTSTCVDVCASVSVCVCVSAFLRACVLWQATGHFPPFHTCLPSPRHVALSRKKKKKKKKTELKWFCPYVPPRLSLSLSACLYTPYTNSHTPAQTHTHTHAPYLYFSPSCQFISEWLCLVFDHRAGGVRMPWTLQIVSTLGSHVCSVSVFLPTHLKTSKWNVFCFL